MGASEFLQAIQCGDPLRLPPLIGLATVRVSNAFDQYLPTASV
jgi:hypothetical protein